MIDDNTYERADLYEPHTHKLIEKNAQVTDDLLDYSTCHGEPFPGCPAVCRDDGVWEVANVSALADRCVVILPE